MGENVTKEDGNRRGPDSAGGFNEGSLAQAESFGAGNSGRGHPEERAHREEEKVDSSQPDAGHFHSVFLKDCKKKENHHHERNPFQGVA